MPRIRHILLVAASYARWHGAADVIDADTPCHTLLDAA